MDDESEYSFFKLRKQGKIYISRLFDYVRGEQERMRHAWMVFEGNDKQVIGEIEGAICLRVTGKVRKTQVAAFISQDDRNVRRLTFQTFKTKSGDWVEAVEKNEFTFRADEFDRLLEFLSLLKFVDLSDEDRFQIEDVSNLSGPKAVIDGTDRYVVDHLISLTPARRASLLKAIQGSLNADDINIILGRKQALKEFELQMHENMWDELHWKDFFEREQWVFGYGLDYRIMRQFDREMSVGAGGVDNRNRPVVDFLMNFTNYTVLVEIKRPDTPIFREKRGGRAGTWEFSSDFMSAISQILEQKAEWLAFSPTGEHYNKAGNERLSTRTRDPKSILVIGTTDEFSRSGSDRDCMLMRDTFELFRRDTRNIEILTFDEMLDRARFITR